MNVSHSSSLSPREVKALEAKQRYNSQKYLLIDTETTGLDPHKNAVVELGAQILTSDLQETDLPPLHLLIRPHENAIIDKRALNINNHHWCNDKKSEGYEKALKIGAAWQALEAYTQQHYDVASWIVLVGWNVGFDEAFLKGLYYNVHQETPTVGRPPWMFHYHKIDLLGTVRYFDARQGKVRKSYKLEHIAAEYYGAATKFAMHTALGDSRMCLKVTQQVEKEYLANVRND